MSTILPIDPSSVQNLRTRLQGSALMPGDQEYHEACLTWDALAAAPTPELLEGGKQSITRIMQALTPATSVQTLYNAFLYNDVGPERTRTAFTEGNYQRLVALKNTYDPQNVFRFNNNIPPSL